MRLVVLFASLFFLLLQGNHALYGGARQTIISGTTVYNIEKEQAIAPASNGRGYVFFKNSSNADHDYLCGEDLEDEDENNVDARKFILAAREYIVLPCPVVSSDLHNFIKASQPFPNHLYHKYITQSVLRL